MSLESMRELIRRVLLSVMALVSKGKKLSELPDVVDELAFDDQKRKEVQGIASAFLHM